TGKQVEKFEAIRREIAGKQRLWLVSGCAGFIGSHLLEALLTLGQRVIGIDNFSTGHQRNLDDVRDSLTPAQWAGFRLMRADIRDVAACREAVKGVDVVLHQAALGSVPRSLHDPNQTHEVNVNGFLNMLLAARDARVSSFVYAASSSAYGDHPDLPKVEERIGKPLSPYALSKRINEMYAEVFARCYDYPAIGLRYFNVFGRRQDPNGAYAAVIPRWMNAMIAGDDVVINGDGGNSRDFCYIENVIQANLLAALAPATSRNQVYNIGVGDISTLNQLFLMLKESLAKNNVLYDLPPVHAHGRPGDVLHSQADIGKAKQYLGYAPAYRIQQGLDRTAPWYIGNHALAE
ncbi:MAG: wbpP, partial [Burkholderia sp.]|nr:wbpP [Burkholderia sp.]